MNPYRPLINRCKGKENSMNRRGKLKTRWSIGQRSLLMLFWLFFVPAVGHCAVSIMPMEAQLHIERPGARLTNDIEVYNSGDAPIHVTTSVLDWSMTFSGQKRFHAAGTQPLSCAPWIQMNPVEFSLPAKQSLRVRYSVSPPADMETEHHAMIFFTSRAVPKEGENRFALNVQTRIGCKVMVTPALKIPLQGKITDMELQTSIEAAATKPTAGSAPQNLQMPAAPVPLSSRVKVTFLNPNPVSVRLSGTVEARNADGQLVAKGEIVPAKALVLAVGTRELLAQFDKPLIPGTYQIQSAIDYGGKALVGGSLKATVRSPDVAPAIAPAQAVADAAPSKTSIKAN